MAGMPQVKLGWIIISGPANKREVARERLELIADTYLSVNTTVQLAFDALLSAGLAFPDQIKTRSAANMEALHVCDGGPVRVLHIEAGWSAILQLPAVMAEEEWTLRLLRDANLIVQPGYFFDMTGGAYLIVSSITPEEQFRNGIEAIDSIARRL